MSYPVFKVTCTCPYCKVKQEVRVSSETGEKPFLVLCDLEVGGCDFYFVAFYEVEVRVWSAAIARQKECDNERE